jgi:hypothetical protein
MNELKIFIRKISENNTKQNIIKLNHELFASLLVFYLILLLIDNIWKSSVSSYIYLNHLLIITIVSGVIAVFTTGLKMDELKAFAHRINENNTVTNIIKLNHELFSTLLVTYLILLLIENIWETSVSAHLNLNYMLIITILSGVITALTTKEEDVPEPESVKTTTTEYLFILLAGLAGAVIIWYKTQEIGKISYIISILSGILIVMLSIIVMEEDETDDVTNNKSQKSNNISRKL